MPKLSPYVVVATILLSVVGACERSAETRCDCPNEAEAAEATAELYALPGLDHGLVQSPVNILLAPVHAHEVA